MELMSLRMIRMSPYSTFLITHTTVPPKKIFQEKGTATTD